MTANNEAARSAANPAQVQPHVGGYDQRVCSAEKGPNGIRTRVGGIKIHSDNHYTIGPRRYKEPKTD